MTGLNWDVSGNHLYETGVSRGVLYEPDNTGVYASGVAWSGLTGVTETPAGADTTKEYADNVEWLNLTAVETFGGTIEAYMWPVEFDKYDGVVDANGAKISMQTRKAFGLCYTTLIGNDVDGNDHGEKIHMAWGLKVAPSEKAFATVNDTPAPIGFSWTFSSTPVGVGTVDGVTYKPTALITVSSLDVDPSIFQDLKDILYGTDVSDPRLPMPAEVITLLDAGATVVDLGVSANQPSYNAGTHVVTLPTVAGVVWKVNGVTKAPGAQPAMSAGQVSQVKAYPTAAHALHGSDDWTYNY